MGRDPGLQAERTALAWSRTALAMLANALILLRAGLVGERWMLAAIGLMLLFGAGLTHAFAGARRRMLPDAGHVVAAPAPVLIGTTVLTAACSGGALLAIIVATGRA